MRAAWGVFRGLWPFEGSLLDVAALGKLRWIAVCLALIAFGSDLVPAAADRFGGFAGLPWGATEATVKAKHKKRRLSCKRAPRAHETTCGTPVVDGYLTFRVFFREGRMIGGIDLYEPADPWENIKRAVVNEYGNDGIIDHPRVRTPRGVQRRCESVLWRTGGVDRAMLRECGPKSDNPYFEVWAPQEASRLRE